MLKLIAQNKYKIMAFIIGLYLLGDVLQHKGQTRMLFPKSFSTCAAIDGMPKSNTVLINKSKNWKKGINTRQRLSELSADVSGFECDVYFDTIKNNFLVHHDADKNIGFDLNQLLEQYHKQKMNASIWLDIKNLSEINSNAALSSLIQLQKNYVLQNKLLIESGDANLLSAFSDCGFYTSYYIPFFNPYKLEDDDIKLWADSITVVIKSSRVNALSGYYFQYTFLQNYFPNYPVLTWADDNPLSLVNRLFKNKIKNEKAVQIVLYP